MLPYRWIAGADAGPGVRGVLAPVPASAGVGGGHFCLFCGTVPWAPPDVAARQSRKTWEGALASLIASLVVGMVLYQYALPLSSVLLNLHLIDRKDGLFALEKPPLWPTLAAFGRRQCGGAAGRSGGIAD